MSWGIWRRVAMTVNGELAGIRNGVAVALCLERLSERTEENHKKHPSQTSLCRRRNSSTAPPGTIQKINCLNQAIQKLSRNLRSRQKITGARVVASNKFHTEDPQILGAGSCGRLWRPGFVHSCFKHFFFRQISTNWSLAVFKEDVHYLWATCSKS